MSDLEHILQFIQDTFGVRDFPDYAHALNGLQVEGAREVVRLAGAVDASEASIRGAVEAGANLMLVHHGLFWDGFGPLTGPRFRKVRALMEGRTGLYALHLPLDAHPELGNSALLARAVALEPSGPFGEFKGVKVGWWCQASQHRDGLRRALSEAVGGEVRMIPGGPVHLERVGILTGAGASALAEAADMGLDALVTGEAAHHHYHDAMEMGVNLFLAGHYATETFGVKALGSTLARKFSLDWTFLDYPTGM